MNVDFHLNLVKRTLVTSYLRERVRGWIREIESQFDLIMITEYFDLGLALVAIELCWPLEYVASVKLNEGQEGFHILAIRSQIDRQWTVH